MKLWLLELDLLLLSGKDGKICIAYIAMVSGLVSLSLVPLVFF